MIFLIADDEEQCRRDLKRVLDENFSALETICEAHNGEEALELALKHKPAAVFLDYTMPPVNGDLAAANIWNAFPKMPIVIVSSCNRKRDLSRFEKFVPDGAGFAYVIKGASANELAAAANAALNGERWIDPQLRA